MIRCIIIEDEPLAAQKLQGFIAQIPQLHFEAWFANPLEALVFIGAQQPDLIFLDIEMEQLTGLQLLQNIQTRASVILTTAYPQHALQAFDLNVTDYLLKPYSFERFVQAIHKLGETQVQTSNAPLQHQQIFLKNGYALENVNTAEILFIEGQKEYLQIVTIHKKILVLMSFAQILNLLPRGLFVRVHRSWIVALSHIETIENDRIMIKNSRIPIGDSFKDEFYKLIHS